MKILNRRDLCRGALSLPMFSLMSRIDSFCEAASSQETDVCKKEADYDGKVTLSLLLHGMFGIIFNPCGVTLLPPHVEGHTPHKYIAGDMTGPLSEAYVMKPGSYYKFDLPPAGKIPGIDKSQNAVLHPDVKRNAAVDPHCTIQVPWPHEFFAVRSVGPKNAAKPLFSDPRGLAVEPCQIPLISVLRYELAKCKGMDIKLKYHILAEPDTCAKTFHPSEALEAFKKMFYGLDYLTLNCHLGMKDLTELGDNSGLLKRDKLALVERLHKKCKDVKCKKGSEPQSSGACSKVAALAVEDGRLGVHPTACMSFVGGI